MKVQIKGLKKPIDWNKAQIVEHIEGGFVLVCPDNEGVVEKHLFCGVIISEWVVNESLGAYFEDWDKSEFKTPGNNVEIVLKN